MNGNVDPLQSRPDSRLKLQALSVSVNYADFLECAAPNVCHFDRWLIVTDANDERTQEVCRRHGLEILISRRLYADGAAFHKAAALNEGLEALDQDAWVVVMDSDILLPRDFRARLAAQKLDPSCLYGLSGRRICRTFPEFRTLADQEPWADNLIYTTFVIGYFNLFHLGQKPNRYPEEFSDDASSYDVAFSDSFPAVRRHYLPFVCLHAGEPTHNWRGRVVDPFFEHGSLADAPLHPSCTGEMASLLGGPDKSVAQIGCYDGSLDRTLAAHFNSVTVIDHWGLFEPSSLPALAADLRFLRNRYEAETREVRNLAGPVEHSDATLAAIADSSLDAVWLTAEPEYDFLLQFLPAWLPKLKPGGAVAGRFYEPQLLPVTSRVVQLLLGTPDLVFPDMQWIRRIANPNELAAQLRTCILSDISRGVVYVSTGEHDVEALLVSLSSLQRHWRGSISVVCAGDESPSLRIACVRLGIDFRNVPRSSAKLPDDICRLHALEWSPFDRTVCIAPDTLVTGPPQFLFDALEKQPDAFCAARSGRSPASLAAFGWRRDSPLLDAWRSVATALAPVIGPHSAAEALRVLHGESALHLLPSEGVWSGAVRRTPAGTRVVSLQRLARAGALHLFQPWVDEEKSLLDRMGFTT